MKNIRGKTAYWKNAVLHLLAMQWRVQHPAHSAHVRPPPLPRSALQFVFKDSLISTTALFVLSLVTGLIHAGESLIRVPQLRPSGFIMGWH